MVKKEVSKKTKKTNTEEELLDTALMLDETCNRILRVLLEDRRLRFNKLQNQIAKMYGQKPTNRDLSRHLKHMINKNLVKQTKEGFQNVNYQLSDRFRSITQLPKEELLKYIDMQSNDSNLPPELRTIKFDRQEFYSKLSKEEVDQETNHDLLDILALNLWELKLSIDNELLLKEGENDEAFWTYFANPTYRTQEKRAAEKCRFSNEYKKLLFEKIDLLIEELRSDKELLRARRAKNAKK